MKNNALSPRSKDRLTRLIVTGQPSAAYISECQMKATISNVNKEQPKQPAKSPKDDQGKQQPSKGK
ncbi:hypothetical protein EcCFBP13530_18615 [Enterobacter cancerogenus]|uniref:Lipoprotein n=2 Tax=Enterobacter cancerogenus TaxID=69218 RepID=A0AB38P1I1_9ENTR|nr:hypothetical protein EcCFBP13530_18615 [Enterobacter cancerogenus]